MSGTINISSAAVYGFKNSVSIHIEVEIQSKPVLSGRKQSPGVTVSVSVTVANDPRLCPSCYGPPSTHTGFGSRSLAAPPESGASTSKMAPVGLLLIDSFNVLIPFSISTSEAVRDLWRSPIVSMTAQ